MSRPRTRTVAGAQPCGKSKRNGRGSLRSGVHAQLRPVVVRDVVRTGRDQFGPGVGVTFLEVTFLGGGDF